MLPVSARDGTGVAELKAEIARRAAEKQSTRMRLDADVRAAAARLAEASGDAPTRVLPAERVAALDDAFADAAGVPTVVRAVDTSTRMRANRATGWPVVAWFSKLKPDPLKRLHLDLGSAGKELTGTARTSVPRATGVQRARVDTEVRALADQVSEGMSPAWTSAIRKASVSRLPDLGDRLDRAVASTDLGADRIPAWAGLVRVLQWLLILTALAGFVWLGALFGAAYLGFDGASTPEYLGIPVPTIMLLGGIALGILLALVCRVLVSLTAKRRARAADKRLRDAISEVSEEIVVQPIRAELASYTTVREGLAAALK